MSAEYQVGGGLPLTGTGVDVAGGETGGLPRHQTAAARALTGGLVGGGQVQDDGGAVVGQRTGRRVGAPQILADLHAHDEVGHVLAGEELVGGEVHLLPGQHHVPARILLGGGGKTAALGELTVVGDEALGHHAQHLAPVDHRGAVVQLVVMAQGEAHSGENIQLRSFPQDGFQRGLRTVQQAFLQEQVAAGVAGDAQLRQGQDLDPLLRRLLHQSNDLPRVVRTVRHPDLRGAGRHFHKSVFHQKFLLWKNIKYHCL